jgi:ribosome-binding protein aMBF1 (putative translation factor)
MPEKRVHVAKNRDTALSDAVAGRVVARMTDIGMEPKTVAKRTNLHISSIHKLRTGRYLPSATVVPKLCRALNITPNALFGWEEP